MHLPPGSSLPAAIQTFRWFFRPAESLEDSFRRYGASFTVKSLIFGHEIVFSRPETLKQIFTGDPAIFRAGEANQSLGTLLGDHSVLVLDGDAHLRERKMLLPPFHGERMQHYTETMRDSVNRYIDRIARGQRFELLPMMQHITLDVILRTVMGLQSGLAFTELAGALTHLLKLVQSPWGAIWMLKALQIDLGRLTGWAAIKNAIQHADELLYAHIRKRRGQSAQANDVLALLIQAKDEHGKGMTDKQIRDELFTLLVAGHETSATSLCWAFEEILRAPGEQDKLHAELQDVLGSSQLTPEHLQKLLRVEAALKESLRLHPPTAAVARRMSAPVTLEGYEIPAGVMVVPCMYLTHRLPDIYPEPERFRPERFIGRKIDPYEWLPFGGGTRRCLGMAFAMQEMKIVLAETLRRLRLRLSSNKPLETTLRSFIYAPKGGTEVIADHIYS